VKKDEHYGFLLEIAQNTAIARTKKCSYLVHSLALKTLKES
jgi:hypothetical protein